VRRKPRGAQGRMASPAQMARLSAVLQVQLPQPISFKAYRAQLRAIREHPEMRIAGQLAAEAHYHKKHGDHAFWTAFSRILHEGAVARGKSSNDMK
jgi:hypothetical protein